MWVHETGCLAFVHIPKNGGTTVTDQLKLSDKFMNSDILSALNPKVDKHDTAATIRTMLKDQFPNPLLFTVLRHPYRRVFSMWRQMVEVNRRYLSMSDVPHKHYSKTLLEKYDGNAKQFTAFLEEMPPWHWHPKNTDDPGKMAYDGWWPQTKWICDKNGKILIDKMFSIDDLKALEDWIVKFNVRFYSHLHANVRNDLNCKLFYDDHSLALVREIFKDDFNKLKFREKLI